MPGLASFTAGVQQVVYRNLHAAVLESPNDVLLAVYPAHSDSWTKAEKTVKQVAPHLARHRLTRNVAGPFSFLRLVAAAGAMPGTYRRCVVWRLQRQQQLHGRCLPGTGRL
jgi:hypothetical protein